MNTKTNHEYASNSYNGGIMGNDSPAALLDMLAEVASQTLHSEKKHSKSLVTSQCKSKADFGKKKTQEASFNVPQLLSMPASQLIKQFSIFTSDELKRQYSYTCTLVVGCEQKYTSFASEGKARMSIKAHLAEHLEYLKSNKEAFKSFTAKSVNHKSLKTNPQNKKNRLQQLRKPQETLNKENKNVIVTKSTNYLRNILLNDSSFKELDKNKNLEKTESSKNLQNPEQKDIDRSDLKVLGDHSYFERMKDEIPNGREASSFNNLLDKTAPDENIVLMVVGTDSVHMKEYSNINKKLSEDIDQESKTIYLPEISWSNDSCNKSTEMTTTKPKGKAKFIGTSKEEREMALAFMDRIKKKGNPAGNNLECRICNPPRSFTAPTTLVSHYRSHAGIKPYECRICRAVFTRRHSLKYHMLIHQNQTRFTCADCGKKFRHPSHFREHRRRHTGEAPFGCDDCGQRFKTRNTYKRHLKTRHGKVLTTTGELLYLSEEDFQKVKTNRKKRNDLSKEHVDEGITATETIMHYENDNDQNVENATEEYIINDDASNSDENWGSNDTVRIIKNCFETYEVCPESHLMKTELTETEIPIADRISNKNGVNLQEVYADEVQDKLPQLQNVSYTDLEVMKDERFTCHDNVNQSELIYQHMNESSSYIKVQYNNLATEIEEGNVIEFEENFEFAENQIMEHAEGYSNNVINNSVDEDQIEYLESTEDTQINSHIEEEYENGNKQIIITQEENDSEPFDKSDQEIETQEISVKDLMNVNTSETINQINNRTSTTERILLNQNESCALSEDKSLDNYQMVVPDLTETRVIVPANNVLEKNQKFQTKQRLYIRNEPLASIIVQNKCINILPHQLNIHHDQENKSKTQVNKNRNVSLLNKHVQTVNIKPSGNQNTIFILSNDTSQNSVFRLDQSNTANSENNAKLILEQSK